ERLEMAKSAKVTFLHRIIGIARVSRKITCERVDLIKVRQRLQPETLRLAAVAKVSRATRHHWISGLTPGRARRSTPPPPTLFSRLRFDNNRTCHVRV